MEHPASEAPHLPLDKDVMGHQLDFLFRKVHPLRLHAVAYHLLEHRDLAAVLLLEHRSLKPDLHARHIPRRDRYEQLWRDLILEGIQSGDFRKCDPAMAAKALLDQNPDPSDEEISRAISGVLCRCAGLNRFDRSIKRAAAILRGDVEIGRASCRERV